MTAAFDSPTPPIPRDRWNRPLVVPPGGKKAVAYTRTTTFVSALEDTYNLERWKMRMTALGLAERDDLMLAVVAHADDKDRLNKVCSDAMEAAKARAAAGIGTALHSLCDQHDRGTLDPSKVPAAWRKDVEAYARATAELEVVGIEEFGVVDNLRIGGTRDRRYRYRGKVYAGDTKSGSIEWGAGKIAMQLATYSRMVMYDHVTQTRTPSEVDQDKALVVHVPAGEGRCELFWVDIASGWADVELAAKVRAHRARKDWFTPFDAAPAGNGVAGEIAQAATVDELMAIWPRRRHEWTAELTELAKARKVELLGGKR